jgi:hypothetical protein
VHDLIAGPGGLAVSAHLEVPLPYRPEPGQTVYEVRAGERVAQVAEGNLAGVLRELVTAVLAEAGTTADQGCGSPASG